jgi:hypothetical protein
VGCFNASSSMSILIPGSERKAGKKQAHDVLGFTGGRNETASYVIKQNVNFRIY